MNELIDLIKYKFKDIKDKGLEVPYFWHLSRCAIRLGENATQKEILCALLHDILEDTDTTEEELKLWGVPNDVIDSIKMCSNIYYKDISHKNWMRLISESNDIIAKKVKMVDVSDNKSYERLIGLEIYLKNELKTKNKKVDKILNRVKVFINKKSYGLAVRFLEDLEILTKGNELLTNDLNLESFGYYEEYVKLSNYIKEDFKLYREKLMVKSFKKILTIKIEKDKNNNDYLVANVSEDIINLYNNVFLNLSIDINKYDSINKKNIRDKNKSHITLLNVMEYNELIKNPIYKNEINKWIGKESTFIFKEIGSIKKENDKTYYAICDNGEINQLRKNLNLEEKDLHMTIGFTNKDLFHQKKTEKTKICEFIDVWNEIEKTNKIINYENNQLNIKKNKK